MRIVIDKATLKRHRACNAAYTSPEWDEKEQALVYSDWAQTIERLIAMGTRGWDHLEWHVRHKLVPMTSDEFIALRAERGGRND